MEITSQIEQERKEGVEFTVYMRQEGKITVPKEVRDALKLHRGDLVHCRIVRVKV